MKRYQLVNQAGFLAQARKLGSNSVSMAEELIAANCIIEVIKSHKVHDFFVDYILHETQLNWSENGKSICLTDDELAFFKEVVE
ncbi:hypothetical protein [Pectobacterium phage Wc4-1]|uniref:Uncharacterized protein n=2 Tax=Arnovirus TaxID=3425109 RepID=A0A5P8D5A9_9CAUD|nr:hypothetical protein Arno162_109 [Pectobacterium phage Arno162]QFP93841.1 hypothetical protein [Pectobacterium phage Wc4]QFP93986.1 hypothetical protein [Pectobacterium phage Wc4-1]